MIELCWYVPDQAQVVWQILGNMSPARRNGMCRFEFAGKWLKDNKNIMLEIFEVLKF